MASPSFDEFAAFVRDFAGLSSKTSILRCTRFENDLGVTGDDGLELLLKTEERFDVQLSSEAHGFRQTFGLAPNEYLFNGEGFNPLNLFRRSSAIIREFTVGELYDAVCRKLGD